MRKLSSLQWIVIGTAIICIVLLRFVSTQSTVENVPKIASQEVVEGHSLDEQIISIRKGMKNEMLVLVNAFIGTINTNRDDVKRVQMYDSLIRFLGKSEEYVYAAFLSEQKQPKIMAPGQIGSRQVNVIVHLQGSKR